MTTVLKIKLSDVSQQFLQELKQKFGKTAEVELRIQDASPQAGLLSEAQFWTVIDHLDWSAKNANNVLSPAVTFLAAMPVANIYLFADKLSEKLYQLDTKQHAFVFAAAESDGFLSSDQFLYARCAVVAEGKAYFEKVVAKAADMPNDISFEALLRLAELAFEQKTGTTFNYQPTYPYETQSNRLGWN